MTHIHYKNCTFLLLYTMTHTALVASTGIKADHTATYCTLVENCITAAPLKHAKISNGCHETTHPYQ